ncbi:Virulence sensor protein BvgS precursor [compost metagenome]
MKTVMIVDEQPVTRHALRLLMEAEGLAVVAETGNGTEALALARQHSPNLLILELSVSGLGGLEIIRRLTKSNPDVKVLVLTAQNPGYFAMRCKEAGGMGFVSKQEDLRQVNLAVKALLHGNTYFPHNIGYVEGSAFGNDRIGGELKKLSDRELTVLEMLAKGMSNSVISERLLLSEKTISTYKSRMMQKLHANSFLELIDTARHAGLVTDVESTDAGATPPGLDEARQHELELLREAIDTMPNTISVWDLDGRMIMCNKQYLETFGVEPGAVIGRFIYETNFTVGEDTHWIHERLVASIRQGKAYTTDIVLNIKGQQRILRHWGRPYRDTRGSLIGLICGSTDITDRSTTLIDLEESNLQLEMANREKVSFISSVTTEMCGPLNTVTAMLDLAQRQVDPLRQREAIAVAKGAAHSLQTLFDDFQSFLRLEEGNHSLRPEPLNLDLLLRQIMNGYRSVAQERGLQLGLDTTAAQQPDVWIDPGVFCRVVDSLVSNAVKFTDQGRVDVTLGTEGRGSGLVEVTLTVKDSGIGIPLADQHRMFEMFVQGTDNQLIRRGGSGAGLALCKRLVDLMNGSLELESQPGQGTRVTVKMMLPAIR